MANIELRNITKKYGNDVALNNLNLEIPNGQFFVL
jgi:ABC-type sugar transport system ATPase subunit